MIEKTESFLKRLRWKAHSFLYSNPDENNDTQRSSKENFGFKTDSVPPQIALLTPFESDMYQMYVSKQRIPAETQKENKRN